MHDLLDVGDDDGVSVHWNGLVGVLVRNTESVHIIDFAASKPCHLFCSENKYPFIRTLTHTEQLDDVLLIEVLGFPLAHYFPTSVRTGDPKCRGVDCLELLLISRSKDLSQHRLVIHENRSSCVQESGVLVRSFDRLVHRVHDLDQIVSADLLPLDGLP